MSELSQDQKRFYKDLETKKFKPIYYLFGDEPFLMDPCVDRLKYSVLDESAFDFNYSIFYAKETDISQIKDVIETLPVFSPYRLVIIKNAQDYKDAELNELEQMLKNPVESTVLAFFSDKIDRRKRLFKILSENSSAVEFKKPFENQYPQWINFIVKNNGLNITNEAIHRLHRLVGNNLKEIENQIIRILEYLAGTKRTIELTDVNAVVSISREESVFDFTRAIGHKDRVLALEQLVSLMDQGESEVAIISLLARHMRQLLMVRAGMDQGIGGTKLANLTGIAPYFIESYCDQARLWPIKKIEEAIVVLHETDKALKSTPISSHIWLENLVIKSCSL
jgi:DNA polymerase-3 subunit delta